MQLRAVAPAKINLALHVTSQGPDGYHQLDSLAVFTEFGDEITLDPQAPLALVCTGPRAEGVPQGPENLILRAAALLGASRGRVTLEKRLPAASGMGGGTSDAATAMKLLAQAQGLPMPPLAAQMRLGADLPLCLMAPQPCRMRGLGENLHKIDGMPELALVLVNPGQELPTPRVFQALGEKNNAPLPPLPDRWIDAPALVRWLSGTRNDLEAPAQAVMPVIADIRAALLRQQGCLMARMTGSGATVFGVFTDMSVAGKAAAALARPGWFVQATRSLSG
jgi:4-diphosphocytidyl-2-C-methyl-D-erythritol kinase